MQRIDYVRKYAFGVMCILKNSEGQFPIRGFWIFRGQDIPQMMKDECYDLELYEWKKLDSKNLEPVTPLCCCCCLANDKRCSAMLSGWQHQKDMFVPVVLVAHG